MRFIRSSILIILTNIAILHGENPKLPIGMNIPSNNYSTTCTIFRDVMKSSGPWLSFNATGQSPWDTEKAQLIPKDPQGYPLELPYKVSNELPPQAVKFMLNNNYKGKFVFLYDGEGEFAFSVPNVTINQKTIITLDGTGENRWISIVKSTKGNHVHNIRILPADDPSETPIFVQGFIDGLQGFHCLRFMDFMKINFSTQKEWHNRVPMDYYSQGLENGVAIEYALLMCNILQTDAWLCIPHQADDDYIENFALLVRDVLDPKLKVYLEYSNELWNWSFAQSTYVLFNAPGANDPYVSDSLRMINPNGADHPEKDAYMMQRCFKIWSDVFGDKHKHRLVRVATVQHAWTDNTRRILQFLFKKDQYGHPVDEHIYDTSTGAGCDAVSPAGYFGYSDHDAKTWEADPKQVTSVGILKVVDKGYWENSGKFTAETARWAKAWNVHYVVYEGGQHVDPPQQRDWPFNEAIWNAQIEPKMYDIYMKLFTQQASHEVKCKLFCAYNYVGPRKVRWGSWGHLENLNQLKDPTKLKIVAPKFQALIDVNTPKK